VPYLADEEDSTMVLEKSSIDQTRILLRVQEAAAMLGVSRAKMYELLAANNEIPVVRIGHSIRVPRAALESWIDEQTEAWYQQQGRRGSRF
jgi:excisionase family DNA binding protein